MSEFAPIIRRIGPADRARIATVEAMQLIQWLERCEALGVDPSALRAAAGVRETQLADPESRVPWHAFLSMIQAAERLACDPLIALRAGVSRPPRGVLVYQSRAQGTLREALAELERNAALAADPVHLEVREEPRTAWLRLGVDEPDVDAARPAREYLAGFMVRFLAEVLGSFRPRQVGFPHAQRGPPSEYERLLGSPVRFRQSDCAIGFARDLLDEPLPVANPVVARLLAEKIELSRARRGAGELRASTALALERLLRENQSIGREAVARRLGLSVRTLQRRLGVERTTFRAVSDDVRRQAATTLLAIPELSLVAVAQRLRFKDEDAFAKAWKRWTGTTPTAHRRARRSESAPSPGAPTL